MASYPQPVLDEIRAAVDIVDLVGRFVNLRKAGQNWKGLCPFHAEKTPSFMVNPKKGIFHCFGCGVGGDAFGFLMRQDRLSFPEAVRALAKQAGVALPEEVRQRGPGESGREELFKVMELAAQFYSDALWKRGGEQAREYLDTRRIDRGVAKHFRLGYAPFGGKWDTVLEYMKGQGFSSDVLASAGLAVEREGKSGHYDRFRDRLLFPIRDQQGRVIAFGGRAFGDVLPKYLNSPETPLYTKGNLLFAIDVALPKIRERKRALIVEGYIDCLMAHQYGFGETVAALGTSFTSAQLRTLRSNCDEAIVFFDADAAGQKAAERAEALLDMSAGDAFWEPTSGGSAWANRSGSFKTAESLHVRVAVLPSGHDPDTFLQAEGAEALSELMTKARSLLSFAFERAIAESDVSGPHARSRAFAKVTLMLAKVPDSEEAASLSVEAARKLGVDPTQLWIEAQRLQASLHRPPASAPARSGPAAGPPAVERDLLLLLLHSTEARDVLLPMLGEAEDVGHPPFRAIIAALKCRPADAAESLLTDLPTDEARSTLASLLVDEFPPLDVRVTIEQFHRRLERGQRLRRARELSQTIAEAQAKTGVAVPVIDELRGLHRETAAVYGITGGVAQSLEHGTPRSPGSADE